MAAFLRRDVVPSCADDTLLLLVSVLRNEPFNLATPQQLALACGRLGDTVMTLLEGEARRRGVTTPCDVVRAQYDAFKVCTSVCACVDLPTVRVCVHGCVPVVV